MNNQIQPNNTQQSLIAALQRVNEQIADIEASRQTLYKTQRSARAIVKEQETVLYKSLIDGKAADKPLEAVATEKARDEAISQAEKELDVQLAQLQAERVKIEREIKIAEYEQTAADVRKILFTCIGYLDKLCEALNSVPVYTPPAGYVPTADAQLTRHMYDHLRNLGTTGKVMEFEFIAPQFMADARKKTKGAE